MLWQAGFCIAWAVTAFMWPAPVRSDKLNEAAGGRERCSFNHTDCRLSFCGCFQGKPGPLAAWSHWWAAWRCCIWVTMGSPIWPICSSAGSPILKPFSFKVCMVDVPTRPHKESAVYRTRERASTESKVSYWPKARWVMRLEEKNNWLSFSQLLMDFDWVLFC